MSDNSRMIYIDTLRMVSPGDPLLGGHYNFFLLGSFDAMKIIPMYKEDNKEKPITCFRTFQQISRQRNIDVPIRYDKQPMCLYTEEETSLDIFSEEGRYASMPLVMTLVQLHDEKLDRKTPGELISAFSVKVNELISEEPNFKNIEYKIFYSVGEADVVIAFRNRNVSSIARLLFRLRTWDEITEKRSEGIRILSICSHCAFPKGNEAAFKRNFKAWMKAEGSQKFVTLVNSSYGAQNNIERGRYRFNQYLLGEYDYQSLWPMGANLRTQRYCDDIIKPMKRPKTKKPKYLRTAFTMPVVELDSSDFYYAESKQVLYELKPSYKYDKIVDLYTKDNSCFNEIANIVRTEENMKSMLGSTESAAYFAGKLESLAGTLTALLKHLIRLREGRFEGDLYAYIVPIFKTLPDITASYISLINNLINLYGGEKSKLVSGVDDEKCIGEMEDLSDRVCALLNEYIEDMSEMVSLLQHLFSVMSVSPHTYLETYGSSMRSIAATCKLLYAYQGIVYRVSETFGMKLVRKNDSGVNKTKRVPTIETMVIVPYRITSQYTWPLFEHSAPTKRIVSVRLDFVEMMNVKETLYLLLHEVGHHIMTPEFRKDRREPLVKAVLAYLLQNGFWFIHYAPFSWLDIMILNNYEVLNDNRHSMFVDGIRATELGFSEDEVKNVLKKYIQAEADVIYENFEDEWNVIEGVLRKKEESFALDNMFSDFIRKGLICFIGNHIQNAYEMEDGGSFREDDEYFVRWINELYVDGVMGLFGQIVNVYAEKMRGESESIPIDWYIDELLTYYNEIEQYKDNREEHVEEVKAYRKSIKIYYESMRNGRLAPRPLQEPDPVMPSCVKKAIGNALKKIEDNYRPAINEVFTAASDIYSDIFAFYMLRLDGNLDKLLMFKLAESYLRLFKREGGFSGNGNCSDLNHLIRMRILLTKCYCLEQNEANGTIVRILFEDSPIRSRIEKDLEDIDKSAFFDYFVRYADICISSIEKRRTGQKDLAEVTKKLNTMYMSASESGYNFGNIMDCVHYFWMASTQRTGV